jgi:hypothetical protein
MKKTFRKKTRRSNKITRRHVGGAKPIDPVNDIDIFSGKKGHAEHFKDLMSNPNQRAMEKRGQIIEKQQSVNDNTEQKRVKLSESNPPLTKRFFPYKMNSRKRSSKRYSNIHKSIEVNHPNPTLKQKNPIKLEKIPENNAKSKKGFFRRMYNYITNKKSIDSEEREIQEEKNELKNHEKMLELQKILKDEYFGGITPRKTKKYMKKRK